MWNDGEVSGVMNRAWERWGGICGDWHGAGEIWRYIGRWVGMRNDGQVSRVICSARARWRGNGGDGQGHRSPEEWQIMYIYTRVRGQNLFSTNYILIIN